MEISQKKKEIILRNAEILQLKTELLIESCTDWLSAEEGNKNMERKIRERKKSEQKEKGITETTNETQAETACELCRARRSSSKK